MLKSSKILKYFKNVVKLFFEKCLKRDIFVNFESQWIYVKNGSTLDQRKHEDNFSDFVKEN